MHTFWKKHNKRRGVYVVPEYLPVVGDANAAILLCQLLYWFKPGPGGKSKLTIERDGKQWIAKSRESLMEECGLTLHPFRDALARLVALKVVEREIHIFQRRTTPHLRVNLDRLEELTSVGTSAYQPVGTTPYQPAGTTSYQPLTEAEITAEITAEVAFEKPNAVGTENFSPAKPAEGDQDPDHKVIKMPTAKEILKRIEEGKQGPKAGGKQGVHWLEMRWKHALSLTTDEFVKGFTGQERGQLKLFITAVGGVEKANEILGIVLPRWSEFAFEAKAAYGLGTAPEKPVVGFLLKYHDVAVQLIAKSNKTPVHPTPVEPPVAKLPTETQLEPDEKVSKEAVQAALAQLKG